MTVTERQAPPWRRHRGWLVALVAMGAPVAAAGSRSVTVQIGSQPPQDQARP